MPRTNNRLAAKSQVIRFPAKRWCVWVTQARDDGTCLVLAGNHGWAHPDYQNALDDARWLARNFNLPIWNTADRRNQTSPRRWRRCATVHNTRAPSTKETTMDMRRYSGDHFIKVDDVRERPIEAQIAVVKAGRFDKADIVFETGDILSLNATNTKILVCAYGPNSEDWIAKSIEMFLGEVEFQKKMQEAVVVRPISPPLKLAEQTKLPPADDKKKSPPTAVNGKDDLDDEIPF
jgi:hypothetical protein